MISRYIWILIEGIISIICSVNVQQLMVNYDNLMQFGTENDQRMFIITISLLIAVAAISLILILINMFKIKKQNKKVEEEEEKKKLIEDMRYLKKEIKKQQNNV